MYKNKILICDLEIINWKQLNNLYNLKQNNQQKFLVEFLNKFHIKKLNELKGAYSFAYKNEKQIILARDLIGIKPICYSNKYEFNCEILHDTLKQPSIELNPRTYLIYDIQTKQIEIKNRDKYYDVENIYNDNYQISKQKIRELFKQKVKQLAGENKKIGILFSGGTDSTLIALTLQELNIPFICYTASIRTGNITEGEDIYYAKRIAEEKKINLKIAQLDLDNTQRYTKKIIKIIHDTNYVKICVALPLFIALEKAKKDGIEYMFSGIGSEEVFADYKRFEDVNNINETCIQGLKSLWERDLYRDYSLAKYNKITLRFPFLDDDFIDYSIRIDDKFKINKTEMINKLILRDILRDFNLSEHLVSRSKKAAQYGSKSARVYEKLAEKKGMKKQEYLDSLKIEY